ncbi:hypothetical protein ABIC83_002749 [Roseateles asaccharophilus]|uniref:hypothetical protein n=1 Tax=Roseateles asaccharophilus TaxID=582607 RepID=UPI003835CB9E
MRVLPVTHHVEARVQAQEGWEDVPASGLLDSLDPGDVAAAHSNDPYLHIDCLRDAIRNGFADSLHWSQVSLTNRVPCIQAESRHAAAIAFSSFTWSEEHVEELKALMRAYIAAGELDPAQVMTVEPSDYSRATGEYDEIQDRHPLVTAIRKKNLHAVLVLVSVGAVEVTDFSCLVDDSNLVSFSDANDKRLAAFGVLVSRSWGNRPDIQAQIRGAYMSWKIHSDLGSTGVLPKNTAAAADLQPQRRRRAGL